MPTVGASSRQGTAPGRPDASYPGVEGLIADVRGLLSTEAAFGPGLYVAGEFTASPGGDRFLARWAACPSDGPIQSSPGCFGNPATLTATSPSAPLGQPLGFSLMAGLYPEGIALLYGGLDGADESGCGLFLPGLGEVLLSPFAPLLLLQTATTSGGSASFAVPIPNSVGLVGAEFTCQAVNVGFLPGFPLESSNALVVTLGP